MIYLVLAGRGGIYDDDDDDDDVQGRQPAVFFVINI